MNVERCAPMLVPAVHRLLDYPSAVRVASGVVLVGEQREVQVALVVHGLMPALLIERGLFAAAEDLLDRCPIPIDVRWGSTVGELPAPVSTGAYYILAELLANAGQALPSQPPVRATRTVRGSASSSRSATTASAAPGRPAPGFAASATGPRSSPGG